MYELYNANVIEYCQRRYMLAWMLTDHQHYSLFPTILTLTVFFAFRETLVEYLDCNCSAFDNNSFFRSLTALGVDATILLVNQTMSYVANQRKETNSCP